MVFCSGNLMKVSFLKRRHHEYYYLKLVVWPTSRCISREMIGQSCLMRHMLRDLCSSFRLSAVRYSTHRILGWRFSMKP
jgi:hypothetical protein